MARIKVHASRKPVPPKGPRNLKKHGFTNGIWRLEERAKAAKARKVQQ
jgi:hypothetical protein